MCRDTRGAAPVYRCTCAASASFSKVSLGTPGWAKTLNRVPELPKAQLGTSTVKSCRPSNMEAPLSALDGARGHAGHDPPVAEDEHEQRRDREEDEVPERQVVL